MSMLTWITPQSNIGNLSINLPVSVTVLASDNSNPNATISYQLISGSLPTGMSLSSSGVISGTPTYTTINNNYFNTIAYNFIIRATSSTGSTPIDGAFSLILTNKVNSDFSWVTPSGNLGTIPNGAFYKLPLEVSETASNTTVTFSFISGTLPPGMQVVKSGFLQGVPTLTESITVNQSETFNFTLRATNYLGHVRDQSFSLSITNVYGPVIEPSTTILGSVIDGTYYTQQLYVNELNPNVSITWTNIGPLPPGITISNNGLLSGYLQPSQIVGEFGPQGYDGDQVTQGVIVQQEEYDSAPYDFNNISRTTSYDFIIQAYDGANYDVQKYILNVVSRSDFNTDTGNVTVDNGYLTVDTGNVYIPVILNANVTNLPEGRSGSYYAYKFDGYDFQGDNLTYSLTNILGTFDAYVFNQDAGFDYGSSDPEGINYSGGGVGFDSFNANTSSSTNLPGLTLDAATGWLYGKLNPQALAYELYNFGVIVTKTVGNVTYSSNPVYFNLPVLGDVNNIIEWVTPSNMGIINNGTVSELFVKATNNANKTLVYSLVDSPNVPIRLPQGLELLSSGEISGRVSFEAFSVDDYTTTFDGDTLTIDRTYNFTVQATTTDGSASSIQEFTLTLGVIDIEPYENLYLRAMPKFDQRQIFNSVISNTEIFVPNLIYRQDDPWFGISTNMDMLFLPGLNPSDVNTYANAIMLNHYTKTYTFGNVETAVVLDDNYNIKYEVIYVTVNDPDLNSAGNGPPLEINLNGTIENPYIDENGNEFKILYPNSSQNMIDRLVSNIGYYDQNSLPEWMTSNQLGSESGTFSPPLGYTRAVVLAYTVPNASNLIAYRLKNSGINFSNIEFTVDRYLLDDYYTTNFNTTTDTYISGKETTFDRLPNKNIGSIVAQVNYAVSIPFDQINGRTIDYIVENGGIDGVSVFGNGDTLIFAKQEEFLNPGPYQGWVNYLDGFIGDNIETSQQGYSSEGYDEYTVIPGFLEKIQGLSTVNQRGGVWQINIVNGIVNLQFILEVEVNQKVQVLSGATYGGAILYYDQTLVVGQSVPYYSIYRYQPNSSVLPTTFNGNTTKFFNYRDQYYTPNSNDKYVKFPQFGVFN